MKVAKAMTCVVCSIPPTTTIREAAQIMADEDVGALPVINEGRLVGMVTDRDIATRGVAAGLQHDAVVT